MIDLSEVQKILNQVSCPACGGAQFRVERERPAEGSRDEDYLKAFCGRCHLQIEAVAIPPAVIEQLESLEPHSKRPVTEGRCPHCGKVGATFNFRCHPAAGVDFDIVTCLHCHLPFKEAILPET